MNLVTRVATTVALVLFLTGSTTPLAAQAQSGASGLKVVARIAGPDGGWDYASFDPVRRRLYVAHGAVVMTVDVDSGQTNTNFAAGAHLHAALPIPGTDLILTTNGADSSARLISAVDGKLVASIPTAADPDGAVFDASTGLVLVVNGEAGKITLIDPKAAKSVGEITVGAGLEFAAVDDKGKAFVNIEATGEIAVIDLAARKVLARYPMSGCKTATGLAVTADGRLISACGNGLAKILDAATGREIASYKIGGFPDAVLIDEARAVAYIPSAMSGTMAVIGLKGESNNKLIDTVPTQLGARTGAVDPKTGRVYLPVAQYILPAPVGKRPSPKPETFTILVLDR